MKCRRRLHYTSRGTPVPDRYRRGSEGVCRLSSRSNGFWCEIEPARSATARVVSDAFRPASELVRPHEGRFANIFSKGRISIQVKVHKEIGLPFGTFANLCKCMILSSRTCPRGARSRRLLPDTKCELLKSRSYVCLKGPKYRERRSLNQKISCRSIQCTSSTIHELP